MKKEILTRPFPPELVKQRPGQHGKTLSYIETHAVISRLNEGCDAWSFEVTRHETHEAEVDRIGATAASAGVDPLSTVGSLVAGIQHQRAIVEALEKFGPTGDLRASVAEVVRRESAPYLAAWRHTAVGLEKRGLWEACWDLQRREDAGERMSIDVPPKYDAKDFREEHCFDLRGALDVPKERFISYPGCESDEDGEPVYGWAGWNHLERAQALAALYQKRKNEEAWGKERLTPMLAGLLELLPWVVQWHNEPSEEYGGMRLGDFFDGFLDGECRALGLTRDDLRAWRPAEKRRGGKAKAKAVVEAAAAAEGEPAPKKKRGRKAAADESGEPA